MEQVGRRQALRRQGLRPAEVADGELEVLLDLLGELTGEIGWTVRQSATWAMGNPHGPVPGGLAPRSRPLPRAGLDRTGLLGGGLDNFRQRYRPRGDHCTDPSKMLEALAHYESALHELVDEAQDRLSGH